MPAAKGYDLVKLQPLPGSFVVENYLGNPVIFNIRQKRLQAHTIVLDGEGFPFLYPHIAQTPGKGNRKGMLNLRQIHLAEGLVPRSLNGSAIV
jgi:hypothetical protein